MKEWLMRLLVGWIADNVTEEMVNGWAATAKKSFIDLTDKLFDRLEPEVRATETQLDDAALSVLIKLRDAVCPPDSVTL